MARKAWAALVERMGGIGLVVEGAAAAADVVVEGMDEMGVGTAMRVGGDREGTAVAVAGVVRSSAVEGGARLDRKTSVHADGRLISASCPQYLGVEARVLLPERQAHTVEAAQVQEVEEVHDPNASNLDHPRHDLACRSIARYTAPLAS